MYKGKDKSLPFIAINNAMKDHARLQKKLALVSNKDELIF